MNAIFSKLTAVLLAVILLFSLCACNAVEPEPTQVQIRTDLPPSRDGVFGVGETINASNVLYTVLSAKKSYGKAPQNRAGEGDIFVCLEIEIENCTYNDYVVGSTGLFASYNSFYELKSTDTMAMHLFGDREFPSILKPGKKVVGTVCYRVPEDFTDLSVGLAMLILRPMDVTIRVMAEDFELVEF